MNNLIIWTIIAAIALVLDIAANSLIFVWFTVGGIAAIVAYILKMSFLQQLLCFAAVSGISLYIRYFSRQKFYKSGANKKAILDSLSDSEITADEDMIEKAYVAIRGTNWKVKNVGEQIKEGDKVVVVGFQNDRILVKKQELPES